jgi:predicted phage terminase large subunit-like protein
MTKRKRSLSNAQRRHLLALQDEQLARTAKKSLYAFVQYMWDVIEPSTPFVENWHLEVLCEYLEEVTAGRKRRLIINLPPRYGKSLIVSVLWPIWEWLQMPSQRFLFASYSQSLADTHALVRRRVLQSDAFRCHWGDLIRLTRDQRTKAEMHNTKGGIMVATSMSGSVTGKGGNRLVIDDPHSPAQADSDAFRTQAIDLFQGTLSTRLNDKAVGAIVLIMQRLHTEDLTALCLAHGYEHLCFPAIAPVETTVVYPTSGRQHIRPAGSALWAARETLEQLEWQRVEMGSLAFEGQYQQQPVPAGGALLRRDWFKFFDTLPPGGQVVHAWDCTFKDGPTNDFVVGLVGVRIGADVYVVDRCKARMGFNGTLDAMRDMIRRHPPSVIVVEEAANGLAILETLRQEIPGIIGVPALGSKASRIAAIAPWVEAGQIFVPAPRTLEGHYRPEAYWVDDFLTQCALFPRGAHDDDPDALAHLLLWFRQHPYVEACGAIIEPGPHFKLRFEMTYENDPQGGWPRRRMWSR